ncbi:MAG: DUF2232 domain-containing protein [Gemmatimonadota bacterium]
MSAALGLAAYLLFAPPVFVLAPLALMLIGSGPSTLREWWWIVASVLWLAFTATREAGLLEQTLLAAGILVSGAFFVMMTRRPRPLFPGALGALAFGIAGLTFWGLWLGIGWRDVELAFVREGWEQIRLILHPEFSDAAATMTSAFQPYAEEFAQRIVPMAAIFPAVMALLAVGGMALAWNWYQRISLRPIGQPLARLTEFRFSDHLVWGVVLGLAALVFPVPPPLPQLGGNMLFFFGGLFAVRGLAVTRTWLQLAPGPLVAFMALSLLFIAPVAVGGLLSLGLADIWLDFRRRFASPTVEG